MWHQLRTRQCSRSINSAISLPPSASASSALYTTVRLTSSTSRSNATLHPPTTTSSSVTLIRLRLSATSSDSSSTIRRSPTRLDLMQQRHRAHSTSSSDTASSGNGKTKYIAKNYIARQQFAHGKQVHYSLRDDQSDDSAAAGSSHPQHNPIRAHQSDEDARRELEQNEKQQLLTALFASTPAIPASSVATSTPTPAITPFSSHWYPLASLLLYFLPSHYPSSVTPYYLTYSKWVFLGSILGTASSVLSMQCLLYALGLGSAALPASAAINWVLKDGLGQLGGMLFASMVSTRFDLYPRKWRFLSAIILDSSVALEIVTPLIPSLFLPLAALANIGKNIAWLGTSASRAAIHRSFLRRENLADVTVKSGSQTILGSLFGTGLGILLSMMTGTETVYLMSCFFFLSFGHILSTYKALNGIVINHVTEERLEKLVAEYLEKVRSSAKNSLATTTTSQVMLSPPSVLQQTEPLFWLTSSSPPSTTTSLPSINTDSSLQPSSWTSSSVNYQPAFDRMVASVVEQPSSMLPLDNAPSSPSSTSDTLTLYNAWLHEFSSVPFIASFSISSDLNVIRKWQGKEEWRMWFGKKVKKMMMSTDENAVDDVDEGRSDDNLQQKSAYIRVPIDAVASTADSPPHLHISLLYKSTATSEDLLQSSLYINSIRIEWERYLLKRENGGATSFSYVQAIREMHKHALDAIHRDSIHPYVGPSGSAGVAASSSSSSTSSTSPFTPTTPSPATSSFSSLFVNSIRSAGYATENHFVQDNNATRIEINTEAATTKPHVLG